jgi:hypothetical protein
MAGIGNKNRASSAGLTPKAGLVLTGRPGSKPCCVYGTGGAHPRAIIRTQKSFPTSSVFTVNSRR